jgi:hypothetical protein
MFRLRGKLRGDGTLNRPRLVGNPIRKWGRFLWILILTSHFLLCNVCMSAAFQMLERLSARRLKLCCKAFDPSSCLTRIDVLVHVLPNTEMTNDFRLRRLCKSIASSVPSIVKQSISCPGYSNRRPDLRPSFLSRQNPNRPLY